MSSLLADLRHALRLHARRPGFTCAVAAVLALGLGASTAVFSLVQALILRPLPFADPDRLVQVWVEDRRAGLKEEPASFPLYRDVATRVQGFAGAAAYWPLPTGFHLASGGSSGELAAEQLAGAFVTVDFFDLLGVRPALGRGFLPEDGVEGADKVVALSDRLWRRRFGADPDVLGRPVTLNGFPCAVIAVMPPEMDFPRGTDVWRPRPVVPAMLADRETLIFQMIARLRPEVGLAAARAELADLARRLEVEHPAQQRGRGLRAVPLAEQLLGRTRPALLLLAGAVAVVLLLTAANVAGLLLARAAAREREMVVRSALGAAPGRLLRQALAESALLALAGGAAGLLLAQLLLRGLAGAAAREVPGLAPDRIADALDGWAVVFGLALAVATGLLAGLAPALHARRSQLAPALRRTAGASGGGGGLRGDRAGAALVVAEVALAVVLLAGAGLLVQSFRTVLATDLGFAPERLLTMETNVHRNRVPEDHQVQDLYGRLLARVEALPGVRDAGLASTFFLEDLASASAGYLAAEGRPPVPAGERNLVLADGITPGFFRTVGLPLLAGRGVAPSDVPGAPTVAVVSAELARRTWPGEDPLGKRVRFVDSAQKPLEGPFGTWFTVVGMVGDARRSGPEMEPMPALYLPLAQIGERLVTLAVRGEPGAPGDQERLAAAIRREARALDPELAFFGVTTVERQLAGQLAARRASTGLLSLFAAFALGLAGFGVYALLAHAVSRSRRELGIRLALGADRAALVRHVAGRAVQLTLGGLALGVLAALAAGRALSSQLVGISAADPRPYALVGVVLVLATLLAALPPALRAARVDPQESLRSE